MLQAHSMCVEVCNQACVCSLMGEGSLHQCGNSLLPGLGIGSSGIVCVCACHRINKRTHESV